MKRAKGETLTEIMGRQLRGSRDSEHVGQCPLNPGSNNLCHSVTARSCDRLPSGRLLPSVIFDRDDLARVSLSSAATLLACVYSLVEPIYGFLKSSGVALPPGTYDDPPVGESAS